MKRTMAVFPPVSGEESDRSVGEDMLEDGNVFRRYTYVIRYVVEQTSVGD